MLSQNEMRPGRWSDPRLAAVISPILLSTKRKLQRRAKQQVATQPFSEHWTISIAPRPCHHKNSLPAILPLLPRPKTNNPKCPSSNGDPGSFVPHRIWTRTAAYSDLGFESRSALHFRDRHALKIAECGFLINPPSACNRRVALCWPFVSFFGNTVHQECTSYAA